VNPNSRNELYWTVHAGETGVASAQNHHRKETLFFYIYTNLSVVRKIKLRKLPLLVRK